MKKRSLAAPGLSPRSVRHHPQGRRARGLRPRRQAAPGEALRLVPRRDEAAGRAPARHGRRGAQGGRGRARRSCPGKADESPLDRGRARRGGRRADAAEAAAAVGRAGRHAPALDRPGGQGPRRRDRPSPPPTHWAFVAAERPEPPAVDDPAWVRNPIDRFILRPARGKGLAPSPEADRATLIRRLSLDLIGLPPTPGGRRLPRRRPARRLRAAGRPPARLARTTASAGAGTGSTWPATPTPTATASTPRASIWKYRDWVIDALNRDLPFDQFTIEQLAGDLLPGRDAASRRSPPGFHRNTLINQEGGIDLEQFRVESVVDRVNTTGDRLPRPDRRLLPVPRPQVRPDLAARVLPALRLLQQRRRADARARRARGAAQRDAVRGRDRRLPQDARGRASRARWSSERRWEATPRHGRRSEAVASRGHGRPSTCAFEKRTASAEARPSIELFLDAGRRARRRIATTLAGARSAEPKFVTTMVVRERTKPARDASSTSAATSPARATRSRPGVPAVLPPLPSRRRRARTGSTWPAGWSTRRTR